MFPNEREKNRRNRKGRKEFPVVQVRSSAILTETKFDFFCCPPKKPFRLSLENRFQKNGNGVKVLQVGIKREAHIKIHYLEQSWKGTMPAKLAELQRNNGNEKRSVATPLTRDLSI